MSTYTPKPDTGTLFPNDYKSNDSHPDFTGEYSMPDGTIRRFAAWANPKGYMSVRFSDRYASEEKKPA